MSVDVNPLRFINATIYKQSDLDAAVAAERERAAKIAESHYANHKGDPATGLIHAGQCHQAIAAAIREGKPQE